MKRDITHVEIQPNTSLQYTLKIIIISILINISHLKDIYMGFIHMG